MTADKQAMSPRVHSALQWWAAVLMLLAVLLMPLPFEPQTLLRHAWGGLLFFVVGLFTVFFSRSPFNILKSILVEFSVAVPQRVPKLWRTYFQVRRRALLVAMLPAVMALVGRLLGLEQTPIFLLWLTSVLLIWLYRTPQQMWQ